MKHSKMSTQVPAQRSAHLSEEVVAVSRAGNEPSLKLKFHNHRECPSWLKAPTSAFTYKTLLRLQLQIRQNFGGE